MSVKGDFAKLQELAGRMRALASGKTHEKFKRVMGAEALQLVQQGLRSGVDPYGHSWAPLAHRDGQTLLDTGRLRSSFSAQPTAKGFELGTNVQYAKFHQYGTAGRAGGIQRRFVNARGRLISARKAEKMNARASAKARMLANFYESGMSEADVGRAYLRRLQRGSVGARFRHFKIKQGSGKIPQRLMVPEGGRLGSIWAKAFDETARRFFSKIMKR